MFHESSYIPSNSLCGFVRIPMCTIWIGSMGTTLHYDHVLCTNKANYLDGQDFWLTTIKYMKPVNCIVNKTVLYLHSWLGFLLVRSFIVINDLGDMKINTRPQHGNILIPHIPTKNNLSFCLADMYTSIYAWTNYQYH